MNIISAIFVTKTEKKNDLGGALPSDKSEYLMLS